MDLTNTAWRTQLGYTDMPLRTPEESGRIVARLLATHHFVVVDQWVPDLLGHRQDRGESVRFLSQLDRFLAGLLAAVDLSRSLVIITSDHGNFEDLRTRRHTRNPVPTVVIGAEAHRRFERVQRLDQVARLIAQALDLPFSP